MTCPNCIETATVNHRKRWRLARPSLPVTLLNLGTVAMPRGVEHKFKCPNCNGIFFHPVSASRPERQVNFVLSTSL